MSDPQPPQPSGTSGGGEAHRTVETGTLLPALQPLAGPGEEPGTERTEPHKSNPRGSTIALSLLLTLAGFGLVAVLIHFGIGRPLYLHTDIRSGKLLLMQQTRAGTFSAAFGSSHVHNGFDPRAFDRALAGTSASTHTVNLAIEGGSQTEQRTMALEFVRGMHPPPASRTPPACFVMLELGAGANFLTGHLVHPRSINIYDRATAKFVSTLNDRDMSAERRWGRDGFAAAAMTMHYMNVGMLSSALLPNFSPDQDYEVETANDRRGLLVIPRTPAQRQALAAQLAAMPRAGKAVAGELSPGNTLLVEQLMAAQNLHGIQYVYLEMPKYSDLDSHEVFPASMTVNGQLVPILDLARPDLYPQLYQPRYWLDSAHLNEAGADVASALIGEQLRAFAAQHPMRCGD